MDENSPEREPDGKFPAGVSGNPVGRPKGSRNKVTLLKLVAEEAARERNHDRIQAVVDDIITDALAGDASMRKLVWNAVMSKGSIDDRSQAQERVVIQIGQMAPKEPEKGITIDNTEELTDESEPID